MGKILVISFSLVLSIVKTECDAFGDWTEQSYFHSQSNSQSYQNGHPISGESSIYHWSNVGGNNIQSYSYSYPQQNPPWSEPRYNGLYGFGDRSSGMNQHTIFPSTSFELSRRLSESEPTYDDVKEIYPSEWDDEVSIERSTEHTVPKLKGAPVKPSWLRYVDTMPDDMKHYLLYREPWSTISKIIRESNRRKHESESARRSPTISTESTTTVKSTTMTSENPSFSTVVSSTTESINDLEKTGSTTETLKVTTVKNTEPKPSNNDNEIIIHVNVEDTIVIKDLPK